MTAGESCYRHRVVYDDGDELPAIPYGDPRENWPMPEEGETCHDCGVSSGGFHHPGCDVATDPRTGRQLLGAPGVVEFAADVPADD